MVLALIVAANGTVAEPPVAKITDELRLSLANSPDELFNMLDANGDGRLGTNEAAFDLALRDGFTAADENLDGEINREEFAAFNAEEVKRLQSERQGS